LKIDPDSVCRNATPRNTDHIGYRIALFIHAGAYIVSLGFDRYFHICFEIIYFKKNYNLRLYHHYQDVSRRDGYLEFYRQTRNLRRTPLFVISLGNLYIQ
jgi:hypothetical protein